MAENLENESYVFYKSFYQGIEELDDKAQLEMYRAITRYGLFGEEPNFTGIYRSYFIQIKTSIASAQKRYKTAVENGKTGGAPEGNQNARKGKTCRKCKHCKSCKLSGHADAEFCDNFEYSQNNPKQPNLTQDNLNININKNTNNNTNNNGNDNYYNLDEKLNEIWGDVCVS